MSDSIESIVVDQYNLSNEKAKLLARGEAGATIDAKGRIIIPASLRNIFEDGGYLTRSLHKKSLVFYPESYWNRIEYWLAHQSFTDKTAYDISLAFSRGTHVKLDAQFRITISSSLQEFASLPKNIVAVGMGSTVEFWNEELLNASSDSITFELPESLGSISTTAKDLPAPGFF